MSLMTLFLTGICKPKKTPDVTKINLVFSCFMSKLTDINSRSVNGIMDIYI